MCDKCESCGIIEHGHLCHERVKPIRGHLICSWCECEWQKREQKEGVSIDFREFKKEEKVK